MGQNKRDMKIPMLICKYEVKLASYERHVLNNTGTTRAICEVQRDLCKEILIDLKDEKLIKVRKKRAKTKLRPARRIGIKTY